MSQILKLSDGNQVKNKKNQDLDQIAANRQKIQQAYDSGQLTADQKAQLDMISYNAQSYLQADPLHNRNARKFQLELTNRMADIVDGKQGYNPYSTEVADKDWFGNYKDHEMGLIANELIRQTLQGQSGSSSSTSSSQISSQPTSTENMHHTYDWLGGTNLDLLPANATVKDKVKAVIAGLNKGINDAETAHAAGKRVHGFDPTKFESAKARLAGLSITDEDDDDAAFNKLIGVVQDGTFAIPADTFKSLFSKYYGGSDAALGASAVATAAKAKGYTQADDYLSYLSESQLASKLGDAKIYSKDGAYYILDANQNPFLTGHVEINTERNTGIYVDDNGQIHTINDVTDTSNIAANILQKIQPEIENIRNKYKQYDEITYDITNQISNDPLLKYVKNQLGQNFTAYDVSNMFFGNEKVLAVSASGKPIEKDYYGRLKYPEDVRFYVLGEDGKLKQFSGRDYANIEELGQYNAEGWNEGAIRQIGGLEELDWSNVPDISYKSGYTEKPSLFSGRQYEQMYKLKGIQSKDNPTVQSQDPVKYVSDLLKDINAYNPNDIDSNIALRNKEWKTNKKEVAKKFLSIIRYYREHPNTEIARQINTILKNPEYQEALHQILSEIKKVPQSKDGGKIEKPVHKINPDTFSKLSALKQYKKK